LYPSYKDEIKKYLAGKEEDLIHLFYKIENDTIMDMTELGKIVTACQNLDIPLGVTIKDIIEGNADSDLVLMLDAKMWIDEEVSNLPYAPKKKDKKQSKFEKQNKIVLFKNKNNKDINKDDDTE
jgi:hypothetical protein